MTYFPDGKNCAKLPAIAEIGIVCKTTCPGPVITVLKNPSPPNILFLSPGTDCVVIVQVASIIATYPVSTTICCPGAKSYSTVAPSISTKTVP